VVAPKATGVTESRIGSANRRSASVTSPPPGELALLFIDGDHSYEGAKADFDRWSAFVRPGGHMLLHDAVDTGGYGNVYPGVARLAGEIGAGWVRQPGAGSIAHFVKR